MFTVGAQGPAPLPTQHTNAVGDDVLTFYSDSVLTQNSDPELLPKALKAIAQGELWIERKMMTELFDYQSGSRLTQRELEVQALIEQGFNNQKIAEELSISVSTVKAHITSLLSKVNAKSRLEPATRRTKNQH
jgi:DNA-binding NarL/FixJ family response regulator